jgi:oligopeptidase A
MQPIDPANPLLEVRFRIPFDGIRAEHVEPAVRALLEDAVRRREDLAGLDGARTFDNTMLALDALTERLDYAMAVVKHLESVATYPELRDAYNAVRPATSEFYAGIPLHEGLWRSLGEFASSEEAARLEGSQRRYLVKTMDEFRRHGAELDSAGKRRLAEIEVELARLTTKFSENVLDATNAFELVITEEKQLAGLPPSALAMARESAASKGIDGWRFTLQAPSYVALMTYLDDGSIRERVYRAHSARASGGPLDNRALIARILQLRREKARLLGFRDFADLALADRMAKTGERAMAFLRDLRDKTAPFFHRETEELQSFRRRTEGSDAPDLQPWDIAYYAEKMRAALYEFDQESLRPYFPLERVIQGLFDIAARLFAIRVTEQTDVEAWDPRVRYYAVHDESGELLGCFYADWHPRENKRGGAWMDSLITGVPAAGGFRPHLGLMCGNLTPPADGRPSLLTHDEVETIFHEFGHLLHQLLSRAAIRAQAGTNVAWDFVELPSQIMENWCWEREALDLFARHYQTGEPIPEDLFGKMSRARNFRSASAQMRQLGFGFVDMMLHREYSPENDGDVIEYSRRILQEFSPAPLPAGHAMLAAFTHLFSDPVAYAAGYYSYKWAEVLDADAFTRFQDGGIFSREAGMQFRERILSRGDSDDPAALYRSFMGRDPDPDALLRRLGLMG